MQTPASRYDEDILRRVENYLEICRKRHLVQQAMIMNKKVKKMTRVSTQSTFTQQKQNEILQLKTDK
jgi:hypothetical protein